MASHKVANALSAARRAAAKRHNIQERQNGPQLGRPQVCMVHRTPLLMETRDGRLYEWCSDCRESIPALRWQITA